MKPIEEAPDRVKTGTICKLKCKPGHIWLPDNDFENYKGFKRPNIDEIKCLGNFNTWGFGNWNFISEWIFDGKAGEKGDIYLRLCVPENFLNKDNDNFQIGSSVSSW